jgi:hypothetical protein
MKNRNALRRRKVLRKRIASPGVNAISPGRSHKSPVDIHATVSPVRQEPQEPTVAAAQIENAQFPYFLGNGSVSFV